MKPTSSIATAAALLASAGTLVADLVAVSNLGQPNPGQLNSNVGTVGTTGGAAAQGFVTGPEASGYQLESVTLRFLAPGGFGSTGDLDVELWDSVAGAPGAIIASFGVNNPDAGGEFVFPLAEPVMLAPDTRYFISASTPDASTAGGQNVYFWEATPGSNENPGGLPGWSIDDGFRTSQGVVDPVEGTPWGGELDVPLQLAVSVAEAAPPPSAGLAGFSHDPASGAAQISIKGEAGTRYKLVEANDLDFANPDRDPVPLTSTSVGTLDGGGVITDANGDATVEFSLGAGPSTFIRAEESP